MDASGQCRGVWCIFVLPRYTQTVRVEENAPKAHARPGDACKI